MKANWNTQIASNSGPQEIRDREVKAEANRILDYLASVRANPRSQEARYGRSEEDFNKIKSELLLYLSEIIDTVACLSFAEYLERVWESERCYDALLAIKTGLAERARVAEEQLAVEIAHRQAAERQRDDKAEEIRCLRATLAVMQLLQEISEDKGEPL